MRLVPPVLLLALIACSDSVSEGWTGSIETMPDGRTVVANPADGLWTDESRWQVTPAVRIGAMEGNGPDVFGAMSGLQVGADGRIYVLDRQANELRIFAPDGSHVRTVGRSGGGPGEYANANGLAWASDDTLIVVDQRGNRYSVLTREGDFKRTVPRALGFFGWVHSGTFMDGKIWELFSVGQGEDRVPALLGTSIDPAMAVTSPDETADRPVFAGASDTLLLPVPDMPATPFYSVRTERGGMSMSIPFTAGPVYHVDDAGTLWHGHGARPRLYRSTLAGDTLLDIQLALTPEPVRQEEIDEWANGEAIERFTSLGGDLDLSLIPENKPYFDAIEVDAEGFVWLARPTTAGATAFVVLDPDGRYLGRIDLPGVERDPYLQPVVRGGRLHFIASDDFGVQRVHVFDIER